MTDATNPLAGLSLVYQDATKTIRVRPNNWMLLRQRPDSATACWMLDADMAVPPQLAGIAATLLQSYNFRYGKPTEVLSALSAALELAGSMVVRVTGENEAEVVRGDGEGVL